MNLEANQLIFEYNALQERFEKAETFFESNPATDKQLKAYVEIVQRQQVIYEKLRNLFPQFDWKLFDTNQKINLSQLKIKCS
jgi:hypothetical protein